eukprot:6335680-Prymnesium_polylepis.1
MSDDSPPGGRCCSASLKASHSGMRIRPSDSTPTWRLKISVIVGDAAHSRSNRPMMCRAFRVRRWLARPFDKSHCGRASSLSSNA